MQGIQLAGLPSSYVSGLSLYFIASQALPRVIPLFSLKALAALGCQRRGGSATAASPEAALVDAEEEARMAALASGMAMPGMPGQPQGARARVCWGGGAGGGGCTRVV